MKICVFCGSSMGNDAVYKNAAVRLAEQMAKQDCVLYYGGANVGLMKIIADKMIENNKKVVGAIPKVILDMEIAHEGLTEMIEVESMSERKLVLINEADAFIVMPGGFGTLDELFELVVLNQLRITDKAVALYNVNHYYDSLMQFINHAVSQGFIRKEHRDNIIVEDDAEIILKKLKAYKPVCVNQWIEDIKEESK